METIKWLKCPGYVALFRQWRIEIPPPKKKCKAENINKSEVLYNIKKQLQKYFGKADNQISKSSLYITNTY